MRNKVHVDSASTKIITMVCSNCSYMSDVLQVYFLFLQITQPLVMEESRKIMYLATHHTVACQCWRHCFVQWNDPLTQLINLVASMHSCTDKLYLLLVVIVIYV